jgi:hypothetical protein
VDFFFSLLFSLVVVEGKVSHEHKREEISICCSFKSRGTSVHSVMLMLTVTREREGVMLVLSFPEKTSLVKSGSCPRTYDQDLRRSINSRASMNASSSCCQRPFSACVQLWPPCWNLRTWLPHNHSGASSLAIRSRLCPYSEVSDSFKIIQAQQELSAYQ